MSETKPIRALLSNGTVRECSLELVPGESWTLILRGPGPVLARRFTGADAFEALQHLRVALERQRMILLCNGARSDVFPSGALRCETAGRRAYVMKLGVQPRKDDDVDIFDDADRKDVGTVAQQAEFRIKWMDSVSAREPMDAPNPGEVAAARRNPSGWLYRISGDFQSRAVPPDAIIGAWPVDVSGRIAGRFVQNARFDTVKWPPVRPRA
jgi:hypothetical protein